MRSANGVVPFFLPQRLHRFPTRSKGYAPTLLKLNGSRSLYTLLFSSALFLAVALLLLFLIQDHRPFLRPARRFDRLCELGRRGEQWTEVLSWEPRAFLYHNFLSREECEYLISLAETRIAKSTVVDDATGKSMDSNVRTSFGMFLHRGQDRIVRSIEERIAEFTHIPVEHGEGLQILQYGQGQKYEPHHDYFNDPFNTQNGGQRMATMLMYLTDVEEGGETVFPAANRNFSSVPWWNELSDCGKRGVAVKPRMGNAVLFWSMKPDGTVDPRSLHGSCPVIKGTKWSAPKWMHVRKYKV